LGDLEDGRADRLRPHEQLWLAARQRQISGSACLVWWARQAVWRGGGHSHRTAAAPVGLRAAGAVRG